MDVHFRQLYGSDSAQSYMSLCLALYMATTCLVHVSNCFYVCLSAALIWNSKELFSYISLRKMDFFDLANSKLQVLEAVALPVAKSAAVSV